MSNNPHELSRVSGSSVELPAVTPQNPLPNPATASLPERSQTQQPAHVPPGWLTRIFAGAASVIVGIVSTSVGSVLSFFGGGEWTMRASARWFGTDALWRIANNTVLSDPVLQRVRDAIDKRVNNPSQRVTLNLTNLTPPLTEHERQVILSSEARERFNEIILDCANAREPFDLGRVPRGTRVRLDGFPENLLSEHARGVMRFVSERERLGSQGVTLGTPEGFLPVANQFEFDMIIQRCRPPGPRLDALHLDCNNLTTNNINLRGLAGNTAVTLHGFPSDPAQQHTILSHLRSALPSGFMVGMENNQLVIKKRTQASHTQDPYMVFVTRTEHARNQMQSGQAATIDHLDLSVALPPTPQDFRDMNMALGPDVESAYEHGSCMIRTLCFNCPTHSPIPLDAINALPATIERIEIVNADLTLLPNSNYQMSVVDNRLILTRR